MPRYFSKFPKLLYTKDTKSTIVTNLLARIATVRGTIDNNSIFYEYDIQEGDTPEIIASKYYDDVELHWVVMLFNDVFDPFYDMPLSTRNFDNYIEDKYNGYRYAVDTTLTGNLTFSNTSNSVTGIGTQFETELSEGSELFYFRNENSNVISFISTVQSINSDTELVLTANSTYSVNTQETNDIVMTGIHHFEKVIETTDSLSRTTTTNSYIIDIDSYSQMQAEPLIETKTFNNGKSVTVKTYRRIISNYDYENELNESKRKIKLIKRELIFDVKKQFDSLIGR